MIIIIIIIIIAVVVFNLGEDQCVKKKNEECHVFFLYGATGWKEIFLPCAIFCLVEFLDLFFFLFSLSLSLSLFDICCDLIDLFHRAF